MITSKVITFQEKSFTVNFPNNRQYVTIQNLKASLASNYDSLQYNGAEGSFAETIVDMESHLTILCPDLIKSLNKVIGELSLIETKQLVEIYVNEVRPWYNECLNFVFGVNKEESKEGLKEVK